jgi:thiol-disulfide isomerase/thioredoxin
VGTVAYSGLLDAEIDGSTGGYMTAMADAHTSGQIVLLDFWATWCGPCLEMEANISTDQAVIDRVMEFVPVKIDVDLEDEIQAYWGVSNIPTFIAFRMPADGKAPSYPEDYAVGFEGAPSTPEDFIYFLDDLEQMIVDYEAGVSTSSANTRGFDAPVFLQRLKNAVPVPVSNP